MPRLDIEPNTILAAGAIVIGMFAIGKFLPKAPPAPSVNECLYGEFFDRGWFGDCPIGYHDLGLQFPPWATPKCRCNCWDEPNHICP